MSNDQIKQNFANLLANTPVYEVPKENTDIILDNDRPSSIAEEFEKQSSVQHHFNEIDGWSIYSQDRYQEASDKAVEVYLRRYISDVFIETSKGNKPLKSSVGLIKNLLAELSSIDPVYLQPKQNAPCSLDGTLDPSRVIAMGNGLLDISNPNDPILYPHTPDFYTFNYLPFNYDPDATCPMWLDALGQYFKNNDGSPDELVPDILHSWIKKWLLRDTSHQKIFAIVGRKRSGKGTIGRLINKLIGNDNVAPLTISQLTKDFGLQPLLNKWLAIMWDASVGGRNSNASAAVETLKCISGEDSFTINRKNKDQLSNIKLNLSIFMIANKLVDLRDSTGALAGRFTFLETSGSYYGNEDPTIEKRLESELPGIFNMVIKAPEGRILEHPKSQNMQQDFEELSSPYIAFINDWCDIDSDCFIPTDVLWAFYVEWARINNHYEPSPQKFKIDFNGSHDSIQKDYRPQLQSEQIYVLEREYNLDARHGRRLEIPTRPRCYRGIDIKEGVKSLWSSMNSPS